MGRRPTNLQAFLRKEVLASRLKLPVDDDYVKKTPEDLDPDAPVNAALTLDDDSLILGASINGGFKRVPDDEGDSIFGEHVLTRDELREKQVEDLLSRSHIVAPRSRRPLNPLLEELRYEVATLISLESRANSREWELIQRQKMPLLEEIRHMEAEEAMREYRERKDQVMGRIENLPEPIGVWEKKRLLVAADRIRKSRAAMNMDPEEVERLEALSPKKRRKQDPELADDFDGEDRIRNGQSLKKVPPQISVTGHWRTTIHDYIPQTQEGRFYDLDAEQRKLMRMELADYAEQAAILDRKQKRMEMTAEWLTSRSGHYGYY